MPTHYENLGVAHDADTETIRRAYVARAKANHPDRRQSDDETRRERADERMRAANAAWHVLRDPQRRADYDRTLRDDRSRSTSGVARPRRSATASAAEPRPSGVVGARPAPPSGMVVPASQAHFWRYAPIVILLAVLLGVLVVSAYASSGGSTPPGATSATDATPAVGDCVRVVLTPSPAPAPVACGTSGAFRVQAVVDTPRPCPTGTNAVALPSQKRTLCLQELG